jgi:hypothetical protein
MSDLPVGSTFAGCRIDGVAGRGGMGVVYRATQVPLGRAVALKVVEREPAADTSFHARFEREMRLTASIDHPNVIPVYEAGETDGRLYFVMRWVQGGDLQQLIRDSGRLVPSRAVDVVAQVGFALEAAHEAGMVHRDVKPANVLMAGNGTDEHVYLSDFGLTLEVSSSTRITESGDWIGTVDFMAPEQFEGRVVDSRTDVYALGCLLHATLTGQAPFPRATVAATMLAHLRDPPPQPSDTRGVSPAFDAVVARALAKRPDDRYTSARELVEAAFHAASGRTADAKDKTAVLAESAAGDDVSGPAPQVEPPVATARLGRGPRRLVSKVRLGASMAVVMVGAGVAALLIGSGAFGADDTSATVSEADVRAAVDAFGHAYAREDRRALAAVLSRDVARVSSADRQRGRAAVMHEYGSQFDANATEDYVLSDVHVTAGALGRASARYEASRSAREAITGGIVFGVRREGGRARIGLIAVEPDS